jgi:hypothetical protein
MIFAGIDVRGRSESPLKTKGVFRDISVRFWDIGFENYDFGSGLWGE